MVFTSAAKELQISDDKAKTVLLRGPISASFGFNGDQKDGNGLGQFYGSDAANSSSLTEHY